MNARNYRVKLNLSPIDFPSIDGLSMQSATTLTDPPTIINNKVELKITKALILTEVEIQKEYSVFTAQSIYEIPVTELKSRENVYEFFKDAQLALNEAYQFAQKQMTQLPKLSFPTPQIETYVREIDGVFNLLNSQN